ncbi:uncharacterized protein [Macrobrachium rosenbergii]|uniref:uncharacterized protein n=1 Tax=Macrobrachium rosenbergii TaxID=79674 RepID=UPI0034D4510D
MDYHLAALEEFGIVLCAGVHQMRCTMGYNRLHELRPAERTLSAVKTCTGLICGFGFQLKIVDFLTFMEILRSSTLQFLPRTARSYSAHVEKGSSRFCLIIKGTTKPRAS